jgi:hypothetical protein
MAETKTRRRTTPAKAPATRARPAAKKGGGGEHGAPGAATTELSEEVLRFVEAGQRAAIEAVTKFVDTVDQAMPLHGEGASKRQTVVDAAMEMADRLVHTQYDFLRKVVHSAGKSLTRSDGDAK